MIDESVLLKFRRNECSASETQEVLQFLEEHPEFLEEFMCEDDWNAFTIPESKNSDPLFKKIYSDIENETGTRFTLAGFFKKHKGIAVIMACALIGGSYYLAHRSAGVDYVQVAGAIRENKDTTVMNKSNLARDIFLPDGSTVKLFPGSSIRYPGHFTETKRDIALTGKGVFYAARDSHRPFTVYAGNTATTALGTVFMVSADHTTNRVNIYLYKGKVAIRKYEHHNIGQVIKYLSPGSGYTSLAAADSRGDKKGRATPAAASRRPDLAFDFKNIPLKDLLDSLSLESGVKFHYKEQDIKNMTFTGTYDNKDQNVDELLTTIGILNGFTLEKQDSTNYIINVKR